MLIKACLNGGTTRAQHHAVPQTPAELAADAAAAVRAGAGAVHLHPRDAVGAETLDPSAVLAAVDAVRAAAPGTPIGVTTGLWAAGGQHDRRMALVSQWTGTVQPDFASVNWSEPGADELAELLGKLLPYYVHLELYEKILESRASEHSARMVAMKSATDNAKQLVKDLTLEYNKARQASITNEILEISSAAATLS